MTSPLEQCRDVLKPCPFCGAKPGTLARPDNIDGSEFYAAVFCHCDGYSATAHAGRRGKTQDEPPGTASPRPDPRGLVLFWRAPLDLRRLCFMALGRAPALVMQLAGATRPPFGVGLHACRLG